MSTPPQQPPSDTSLPADGVNASDVLDFIGSLVASLAWPVAVLLILLVFKSVITKLVDSLKERMPWIEHVKTPWGEAAWREADVNKLASNVKTSLQEHHSVPGTDEETDVSVKLARIKPSAGVVDAFMGIEHQVVEYYSLSDGPPTSLPIMAFRMDSDVPRDLRGVVDKLAQLRNAAAHGRGDISEESALTYIATVHQVTSELKQWVERQRHKQRA